MKIIDAHIHTAFQRKDLRAFASKHDVDFSLSGLKKEIKDNNIKFVVSLADVFSDPTPLGKDWIVKQVKNNREIIAVLGINPFKVNPKAVKETEKLLKDGIVKGLKIYLGYYAKYPTDKVYTVFYKMAQKYNCPVIFHTGDTLSLEGKALVKYARPLNLDEVAVKWPKLKIIIAHSGYPWIMDAAEVAYKNKNVFLDISGWSEGNHINPFNKRYINEILAYVGPDKILYGSDWPIVKMKFYINFFKKAIPKRYWSKIFYENASKLFKIK